jgi:hypothetical protein
VSVAYSVCVCVCVCVGLSYPACKAHAPNYIVICDLSGSTIFLHPHKRCDFREKVVEHNMCALMFSATFISNISHSKENLARCHKCTGSSCKVLIILSGFN